MKVSNRAVSAFAACLVLLSFGSGCGHQSRVSPPPPPPPVNYACSTVPAAVFPGAPVTVTAAPPSVDRKGTTTYRWSGQGFTVTGSGPTATINTSGLAPGEYRVEGHVTEGAKPGESADCTVAFTVKAYEPPTISCISNPSTVMPGDTATITAAGVSPQNLALAYSYTASAGSISGSGPTATLSTAGAPAGTITVTCTASDNRGHATSAITTVSVILPAAPPAPTAQGLCSISLDRTETWSRGKEIPCLDDVALNAQRSPDAALVIVGSSPSSQTVAAQRAVNAKAYLVREKGIDPSRISVRTGSAGVDSIATSLVPAGAAFDNASPGTTPVNEAAITPQPTNPGVQSGHTPNNPGSQTAPVTPGQPSLTCRGFAILEYPGLLDLTEKIATDTFNLYVGRYGALREIPGDIVADVCRHAASLQKTIDDCAHLDFWKQEARNCTNGDSVDLATLADGKKYRATFWSIQGDAADPVSAQLAFPPYLAPTLQSDSAQTQPAAWRWYAEPRDTSSNASQDRVDVTLRDKNKQSLLSLGSSVTLAFRHEGSLERGYEKANKAAGTEIGKWIFGLLVGAGGLGGLATWLWRRIFGKKEREVEPAAEPAPQQPIVVVVAPPPQQQQSEDDNPPPGPPPRTRRRSSRWH